jgi:pimeloyl-ACP methyl ester carboxylesterase
MRALAVVDTAPETSDAGRRAVTRFTSGPSEFESTEEIVARVRAYNPRRPPELVRGSLQHSVRQRPDGKWTWKYDPAIREARLRADNDPAAQWEAMARLRCPVLFVLGAESGMVSPRTVERMLDTVPGSRAEYVPGAGHLVPGDNPAGFDAVLRGFLDSLPP